MATIEFVKEINTVASDGGTRAATAYLFQVDSQQVTVEVTRSARTMGSGKFLSQEKAEIAARSFLESELKRVGPKILNETLVLDDSNMNFVFSRLGWPPRF